MATNKDNINTWINQVLTPSSLSTLKSLSQYFDDNADLELTPDQTIVMSGGITKVVPLIITTIKIYLQDHPQMCHAIARQLAPLGPTKIDSLIKLLFDKVPIKKFLPSRNMKIKLLIKAFGLANGRPRGYNKNNKYGKLRKEKEAVARALHEA